PRLLQLALNEGQAPLEVLLFLLEALNLTAQPPELAVPSRLLVGLVDDRRGAAQHCASAHLDLFVGRPVLLPGRRGIPGPLDACADLGALLERDRPAVTRLPTPPRRPCQRR